MRAYPIVLSILGVVFLTTPAAADVFRPDDVCGPATIEDVRLAPDGSAAVYVLRTCSLESNDVSRDLWFVETGPGDPEAVQLTTSPAQDHSPRWSPDGASLAFVSTRDGEPQLFRFDGFFGEPRQVTHQAGGVSSPLWTPDGKTLVYVSRGTPATPADEMAGEDVAVHTDLLYRKGSARAQGRLAHVYRVDALGGAGVKVTYGQRNCGEPAISPDGATLAVVREAEHDGDLSIDDDVWLIPLGGGTFRQLTTDQPGPDHQPAWSPDGATVYTRSILEEGYESGRRRILAWPVEGGGPAELTRDLDHHVFRYQVDPDGTVHALMDAEGTWQLGRLEPARPGGLIEVSSGTGWIWQFHRAGGRTIALLTAPDQPGELWLLEPEDGAAVPLAWDAEGGKRRVTRHNAGFVDGRLLSRPRAVWIDSPSGRRIQVWYYPPAQRLHGPRTPLLLWLHGGPQWCAGERWDPEIQALAGAGYGVLAVNFTGSLGYGQAFIDAVAGDWGGAPYQDAMAAVDWALAEGLADAHRLGVTGGSYGGFLAGYAVGQSDRFGAAVLARAVTEQVSEYGTTDEQFFAEQDLQGTPWTNPEGYARWSPLTYADRIHTPTMLIHSENDVRVPLNQAEQLFTALITHDVPAELVVFPGEGHGLSRHGTPVHRRERLRHMIRWFDTYLR